MLRGNADGRLLKLSIFSTVLDKSPLTSIYFTTFEKKRKVRSPLPRQSNFLVFGIYFTFFEYMSIEYLCLRIIMYLVKYKSVENCKTSPKARSMKFPFERVVYHPCTSYGFPNTSTIYL